jgi:hypothetical protein
MGRAVVLGSPGTLLGRRRLGIGRVGREKPTSNGALLEGRRLAFPIAESARSARVARDNRSAAMVRAHQPGEGAFKAILPEDIDWKPFPAFPPSVRLAVVVGQPSEPGPYVTRVKASSGAKLMPHKHPDVALSLGQIGRIRHADYRHRSIGHGIQRGRRRSEKLSAVEILSVTPTRVTSTEGQTLHLTDR